MVCLGFEPETTGWYKQINTLSNDGPVVNVHFYFLILNQKTSYLIETILSSNCKSN